MYSRPSNDALWPLPPNALVTDRVLVAATAGEARAARVTATSVLRMARTLYARPRAPSVQDRAIELHPRAIAVDLRMADSSSRGDKRYTTPGIIDYANR